LEGSLTSVDVQRRYLWKSFRGKPNRIPGQAKSVRLPPGILFAFSPESCSDSTRNAVRLHPGNLFGFARNPQKAHLLKLRQLALCSPFFMTLAATNAAKSSSVYRTSRPSLQNVGPFPDSRHLRNKPTEQQR
jgi:hypothetical protein